jgi:glycosyltransferase involved in cell wall biosynthesis
MPDLSVAICTYNERGNVPLVCERLAATLNGGGVDWEIIFSGDPSIDAPNRRFSPCASATRA